MCPKKIALLLLMNLVFILGGMSQRDGLKIKGGVKDLGSGDPVPYATVAVLNKANDAMMTGTTTDDDGRFVLSVTDKNIKVEVSFIGYSNKVIDEVEFINGVADLGDIILGENQQQLDEVEVVAEKSTVEFKLDKRVFNVGKDISSTGMGALDVLNNVPSVNVDIEGQISLRGNQGVQILINGKPSVMSDEGSNALGTITADMIESVEVITNPSAKYEAEGTSGIINIVLKKEEKKGFNGSVTVNTGIPDNHSVGVSLNRRTENFNFFTQFGAGYRSLPSYRESINRNLEDGTYIKTEGVEYRNEDFYNITLGTDYHLNDLNVITLSGQFAYEVEEQPSETEFEFYDESDQLISSYERTEETSATNPKYQYDLQYKKQFTSHEDHVLLFSTLGSFFGKDLSSEFNNEGLTGTEVDPNQLTETEFYKRDFVFKLDYTNPISKKFSVETGAHFEINDVGNDYAVFDLINGESVPNVSLTNNFEYRQQVLGVYGTASYEGAVWGVKVGLRVENTDLNTFLTNTNEENQQNYTNLFPSLHTSYKFSPAFSMQAGYSRRVFRPRLWDLNPFFNVRNNYNIRAGNPNLMPEFADSYELTAIWILGDASLNGSVYHLYTEDVIERVAYYENDVTIRTPENIGTRNKTGVELNGKYSPLKWLTLNGDINYGFFTRNGMFEGQDFDFTGDQWSSRLTLKFQLPADFDVEFSGNYQSEVVTVQGTSSGNGHLDVGVRKKLWKGKAVVNFSVRDVFATRIRESYVYQPTYSVYDFSQRGRFFTLGISYSFGKGEAMTYTGRRHR